MSDAAAPAPSAPTAAPAPSAPASPAPQQTLGVPPTGNDAAPPSGEQQAPPKPSTRIPWKTKIALDDLGEREVEVDVDPFLREYKRKVKLDGEEVEIPIDEAYKSTERFKSSMKRFQEAAQTKREVEAERAALAEKTARIEKRLSDPEDFARIAPRLLKEHTGPALAAMLRADPALLEHIAPVIRERLDYEQMPEDQRQRYDRATTLERQARDREYELTRRARELEEREAKHKADEESRVQRLAQERRKQLEAEVVPLLEGASLPVRIKGPNGEPALNRGLVQAVFDQMVRSKQAGYPMTMQEAVQVVREEREALLGTRQAQAVAAADAQPGRSEPTPPAKAPAAPRRVSSLEEYERRLREGYKR